MIIDIFYFSCILMYIDVYIYIDVYCSKNLEDVFCEYT